MKLTKKSRKTVGVWFWIALGAATLFGITAGVTNLAVASFIAKLAGAAVLLCLILLVATSRHRGRVHRGRSWLGIPYTIATGDVRRPGRPAGVKK